MSPEAGLATTAAASPVGRGGLVVVVGPSGVGKDSLINYARQKLCSNRSLLFVRRVVTRAADASTEDHDSMTEAEFEAGVAHGAFAVTWEAHGLKYGLPAAALTHVRSGEIAIANGSRAALAAIRNSFPRLLIVQVTARRDILEERLRRRRRETESDIRFRLSRFDPVGPDLPSVEIDNSHDIAIAGEALTSTILLYASEPGHFARRQRD